MEKKYNEYKQQISLLSKKLDNLQKAYTEREKPLVSYNAEVEFFQEYFNTTYSLSYYQISYNKLLLINCPASFRDLNNFMTNIQTEYKQYTGFLNKWIQIDLSIPTASPIFLEIFYQNNIELLENNTKIIEKFKHFIDIFNTDEWVTSDTILEEYRCKIMNWLLKGTLILEKLQNLIQQLEKHFLEKSAQK